jgi:FkbM family methyltransferase
VYNTLVSSQQKPPFLIDQQDELSVWRYKSFYEKEPETIKWIDFFAASKFPLNFLDVGANIGMYSLYFLSLVKNKMVICVEPFQKNFELLTQNLRLNNYVDRAQVINIPLSSEIKRGSAIVSDERPGGSGYKLIESDNGHQESIDVQVLDIDSILCPFDQKYVLKIDTDGSDFEILQGGIKSLQSGCIISILIEASQDVQEQISDYLKSFDLTSDYRFNDLSNHSDRRRVANNKEERNRVYTQTPLID